MTKLCKLVIPTSLDDVSMFEDFISAVPSIHVEHYFANVFWVTAEPSDFLELSLRFDIKIFDSTRDPGVMDVLCTIQKS